MQKLIDQSVDLTEQPRKPWPAKWILERQRIDAIKLAAEVDKELKGFWGNTLTLLKVEQAKKDEIISVAKSQVAKYDAPLKKVSRQISNVRQAIGLGKAKPELLDDFLKERFRLIQERDEKIYAAIPVDWRNNIFAFRIVNAVGAELRDIARYKKHLQKTYYPAAQKVAPQFLEDPKLYYNYERFHQEVNRIIALAE